MSSLPSRANPPLVRISAPVNNQIAEWLTKILGSTRPRRVARMSHSGEHKKEWQLDETTQKPIRNKQGRRIWTGRMVPRDKYEDIPGALTRQMLLGHASGKVTYSCTLDRGGVARAGVIDVDSGGKGALQALLHAAQRLGYTAFAIFVGGDGAHDGGHVWCIFDDWYAATDIKVLMQQIATEAQVVAKEFWPQNQGIRLPFGYHQTKGSRGELLTQGGEVYRLDQAEERAAALVAVLTLPMNTAPPLAPAIEDHRPTPLVQLGPRRIASNELKADRPTLATVRAGFNAEHSLEPLLADYGAERTSDGFTCPCGILHTHTTTLYISREGKLFSFSPRCRWYTTKGWDAFGLYVLVEHNNNVTAALKVLNPIAPGQRRAGLDPPDAQAYLTPAQRGQHRADATRKREARRQEAAATLADVRARAAHDDALTPCDRAVLDSLLTIADGRSWCRPSKPRIAELCGYSLGSVKRSLMILEDRHYFTSEGDGGTSKQTAIRRFLRGSLSNDTDTPFVRGSLMADAEPTLLPESSGDGTTPPMLRGSSLGRSNGGMIHESHESCDLIHESQRACERRGRAVPATSDSPDLGEPDSLDTWTWRDAPIDANDLAVLDGLPVPAAESTALPQPRLLHCGPWYYIADGIDCGPTGRTENEAWKAWAGRMNTDLPNGATPDDHARARADLEAVQTAPAESLTHDPANAGEATYHDNLDWTAQNRVVPVRVWHADLRPRDFERWNRRPDLGGAWELRHTLGDIEREQQPALDAGDIPETTRPANLLLLPPRKGQQQRRTRSPAVRERYAGLLATRSAVELAGELRKHQNTLKKHAGAVWLDQIRDKLVLVEAEIDRRATSPPGAEPAAAQFAHRSLCGAPSQAPPAPR